MNKRPSLHLGALQAPVGARRNRKRVGRGEGSGHGGTSTRGHKGQKARAGGYHKVGFEGGQTPLARRLPKRGFHNPFRRVYDVVNVGDLARLTGLKEIDPKILRERRLIRGRGAGVKVLGDGELKQSLIVKAHAFSKSAREKIEGAGGQVLVLTGGA